MSPASRTAPPDEDIPPHPADSEGSSAPAARRSAARQPSKPDITVDEAAERAVLAAILVAPAAIVDVTELLVAEDFGIPAHVELFRALVAVDSSGRPVDKVTVADELKRAGQLTKVGGRQMLEQLLEEGTIADNVAAHCEIVAELSRRRQIITAGRSMVSSALDPANTVDEVRAAAEQAVFDLGRTRTAQSLVPMAQAVPELLQELANSRNKLLLGHSTGFTDLDRLTAGLQPGQLVIVAARPGMGKSSLALQIAAHVAETTDQSVAFLSYEMSQSELAIRLLSSRVGVSASDIRLGLVPHEAERDISVQAAKMAQLRMFIDDNPPEDIVAVRSAMRRLARRTELGLIVIDYVQLMAAQVSRYGNRTEEVSAISRGLKRMATELGVPVIALSQLSRALEQRPNKRPQLSDLRESGSLEQDASTVLFIYRDSIYNPAADPSLAELIIAKQRSGQAGVSVNLEFEDRLTRFKSTTRTPAATFTPPPPAPAGGGGFGPGWNGRQNAADAPF